MTWRHQQARTRLRFLQQFPPPPSCSRGAGLNRSGRPQQVQLGAARRGKKLRRLPALVGRTRLAIAR